MSRSLRPILIAGGVILVAAVLLVLLIFVFPKQDGDPSAEASPEPTESTQVKIIDADESQLVSFEVLPREGEGDSMLVEIARDDDGNLSYTVTPAAQYFDYDGAKFHSMMYSLTSVTASNMVEEHASDLAQYGLDDPWYTLRCTYADGSVIDLCIGNATPTDRNYYVRLGGEDTVYTLGSYLVGLLTRGDLDYRQITLFPYYEGDELYESVSYVKLTQRDGTEIELSLEDAENPSEGIVINSQYYMTLPTQTACNDYMVKQEVIDVLATLENTGTPFDITEEEYAEYGFNNPAELEMRDIYDNSLDLVIGKAVGNGYHYAMLKQAPDTVIYVTSSSLTWLDINYIDLMNRTAWYVNIKDIASIEYTIGGESYLLDMTHAEGTTETGVTRDVITATLNGDPIAEVNARRLFTRTLNFRIMGEVGEDAELPAEPYIRVIMHRLEGEDMEMEIYALNDRQYALAVNGTLDYYVYKKNITTLEQAFETVLAGGELPMSYDA